MNFTTKDLLAVHDEATQTARALMRAKNHDYAGSTGTSPFANFERSQHMGLGTTEQGILVRLTDKISRLSEFAKAGLLRVADESVEDTCVDIINYAVIFMAYRRATKGHTVAVPKQIEFHSPEVPKKDLEADLTSNRMTWEPCLKLYQEQHQDPPHDSIPVGTYKATEYVPNPVH